MGYLPVSFEVNRYIYMYVCMYQYHTLIVHHGAPLQPHSMMTRSFLFLVKDIIYFRCRHSCPPPYSRGSVVV